MPKIRFSHSSTKTRFLEIHWLRKAFQPAEVVLQFHCAGLPSVVGSPVGWSEVSRVSTLATYSDSSPNDAPSKHAMAATSPGCEIVVTVMSFAGARGPSRPCWRKPTTTAGVVENNGTHDALNHHRAADTNRECGRPTGRRPSGGRHKGSPRR